MVSRSRLSLTMAGGILLAMAGLFSEPAQAACNATINGRPMTMQECQTIRNVYGSVLPGHYLVDGRGNWVNRANPFHRGNIYADAQRRAQQGSGGGMTHNRFGSVGGGCVWYPGGGYC